MKRESRLVRFFPVFLACLWLAACGNVQVKPDQPIGAATPKPTVEDKRAGLVGIAPGFTPKAYRQISVEIFAVTDKNSDRDDDMQFAQVMPVYLQAKFRQANGRFERLPDLARDLVGLKLDVIVTTTDVAIAAVKRETHTIPIVMATSTDLVGTGFVESLAHPGGNITGLNSFSPELGGKRLQVLREAVPGFLAWRAFGIQMSGVRCLITKRRTRRPVHCTSISNRLKYPAPRISIALSQPQ